MPPVLYKKIYLLVSQRNRNFIIWSCFCQCMSLYSFSELQKVRQQVVKEIKSNQQLEHDLDQMDIKIGLLIKNRITLQVNEDQSVSDLIWLL